MDSALCSWPGYPGIILAGHPVDDPMLTGSTCSLCSLCDLELPIVRLPVTAAQCATCTLPWSRPADWIMAELTAGRRQWTSLRARHNRRQLATSVAAWLPPTSYEFATNNAPAADYTNGTKLEDSPGHPLYPCHWPSGPRCMTAGRASLRSYDLFQGAVSRSVYFA